MQIATNSVVNAIVKYTKENPYDVPIRQRLIEGYCRMQVKWIQDPTQPAFRPGVFLDIDELITNVTEELHRRNVPLEIDNPINPPAVAPTNNAFHTYTRFEITPANAQYSDFMKLHIWLDVNINKIVSSGSNKIFAFTLDIEEPTSSSTDENSREIAKKGSKRKRKKENENSWQQNFMI